jgi:hypothetical protein
MHWKGLGRKWSWHNQVFILEFAWRNRGKTRKTLVNSQRPSWNSNWTPLKTLAGMPAKIQTQHLPNTSDKHYLHSSHDQPIHATLLHCYLPSTAILPMEKPQQLSAKLATVMQTGCTHKSSPNFLSDTENIYTWSLTYEWSKAPFMLSSSWRETYILPIRNNA